MLVLTRKQSEKICIGNDITITVLKMKGKSIRLGIEAPAHINVLRGELVIELPAEEFEQDTLSKEKAKMPATVRQPVKAHRHPQPPATHWPTATKDRSPLTQPTTTGKPDSTKKHHPSIL
jgi:carbon storage regulator